MANLSSVKVESLSQPGKQIGCRQHGYVTLCVDEFKCPVSLWGAHNSFLFSSSFLFTCHEVTALSCIGFHDINSAVDATIACAPAREDQLIPILRCEYTSIIKWILTASKGPFHDEREELMTIHSIGCLDNFACSQNGSAHLSHNVWLSCLFGDIHFKQSVKRIAKQRPSAQPLVDPTLHIAYKVDTIPYWHGWYGNQRLAYQWLKHISADTFLRFLLD